MDNSVSKKSVTPRKDKQQAMPDDQNAPVLEEEQDESLEEILLQELLQKNTELQQTARKLRQTAKELSMTRHIIACQPDGIVYITPAQEILFTNKAFCDMTGFPRGRIIGKELDTFITMPETDQHLTATLQKASGLGSWQGRALLQGKDENQSLYDISLDYHAKNAAQGVPEGFVCQLSAQQQTPPVPSGIGSSALFSHDSLTGLPDRTSFQHHLALCLSQAQVAGTQACMIYIDLDNFKRINKMMGPTSGDEVLCQVTHLLQKNANAEGGNFTARLSSDEFAIILPPPSCTEQAEQLARRILDDFQQPLQINSRNIFITPSIGITLYPDDGKNPQELFRNADAAMEIVKGRGGNNYCCWESDIEAGAIESLHLENDLRHAVANKEIFNYYQPQIDLITGKIIGMEALARWEHPEHGFVSPVVFIPLAVNAGLIDELGLELVRQACEDGIEWMKLGFRDFTMAVNLSGRLLRRLDLFDQIIDCLESTGFPAKHLEVEFTESVLIENIDNTIDLISKCREKGIKMAIDDFGTGYSSLSYLQRFAVDKIKIDRSFITDVTTNQGDAAITMAIIAIAKKLDFEVLAEGVETEEQLYFLQENQCDSCQGFLFSKPISRVRMKNLLMRDASVALKHRRILDKFYSIKAQNQ